MAGALGIPLRGFGTALHLVRADQRWVALGLSPLAGLPLAGIGPWRIAISSLALVLAIGAGAWTARRRPGPAAAALAGSALISAAGIGIAGEGAWAGLSRLAWFHLALTLAIGLLGRPRRRIE